jgi:hypothetical protein
MPDKFLNGAYTGFECDACGKCCTIVMFPEDWYDAHRELAVTPVVEEFRWNKIVIPFTDSGWCCFKRPDGLCNVQVVLGYADKPDVCKNWDCEGHKKIGVAMHSWITTNHVGIDGQMYILTTTLETGDSNGRT